MNDNNNNRNDKETQFILDWNTNDTCNSYDTIEYMVNQWEEAYLGSEQAKEYIIKVLYVELEHQFNSDKKRGQDFLEENEIDYDVICAIENLYERCRGNIGWDINKSKLEQKLDYVFYIHATMKVKKILKFHKLDDVDY